MQCPKCNRSWNEREAVKVNIVYAAGIPVEYDAQCPACSAEIGHVFWGELTPAPAPAGEKAARCCPHCGKPLPE